VRPYLEHARMRGEGDGADVGAEDAKPHQLRGEPRGRRVPPGRVRDLRKELENLSSRGGAPPRGQAYKTQRLGE